MHTLDLTLPSKQILLLLYYIIIYNTLLSWNSSKSFCELSLWSKLTEMFYCKFHLCRLTRISAHKPIHCRMFHRTFLNDSCNILDIFIMSSTAKCIPLQRMTVAKYHDTTLLQIMYYGKNLSAHQNFLDRLWKFILHF